jgi:hypothetical protein
MLARRNLYGVPVKAVTVSCDEDEKGWLFVNQNVDMEVYGFG